MLRTVRSVRPFETDPILIVDANAVRIRPIALQFLKVMPGKVRQIAKARRRVQPIESPFRLTTKGLELLDACTRSKSCCPSIAKAADHDDDGLDL